MFILFFSTLDGIKDIVVLEEIVASTPVLGFLPILSFLNLVFSVPKEEILSKFLLTRDFTISSMILSTKNEDSDLDIPISLVIFSAISILVTE